MRKFLSLFTAILFAGSMMAADPVEIASGTFNGKDATYTEGWSTTGTGVGRTDCVIIGAGENITSPSVDLSQYESISIAIKARRFASLSGSKAEIAVAFGSKEIGSTAATQTSATTPLDAIEYTVEDGLTTGNFVFTCTNATSAGSTHGAGINSIVITGTKKAAQGGETSTKTIYCKVAQDWWKVDGAATGVYAYGNNDAKNAEWPGVRMTAVEGEDDLWKADIDTALYHTVIFTRVNASGDIADWGAKTGDQQIPADKDLFTITSTSPVWGDPGAAGAWSVYGKEPVVTLPVVALAGTMNDWSASANVLANAEDSLTASVKITLEATDYYFKIVSDGKWLSLNGEGESLYGIHREWNKVEHINGIDLRNFKLTADVAGEYTFTWTYADSTLLVTFPEKPAELQAVSEATTWDFSKITANTANALYANNGIQLTDESTPSKNDEVVYANYSADFMTFAEGFDATTMAFKGEYPIRKNQYCQAGTLHFKTTVAGKITVKFSDTGTSASSSAVKRYLVVNGEQTEFWTSRENNGPEPYAAQLNVTSGEIAVAAGDVTITGSSAIIVSNVTFAPSAEEEEPVDLYLLNAKALTEANAKMFVHAWGDGMSDQDVEMSILKEGNDTLGFSAKINKLAEHMIFVRMNGEAESINWEDNWGKTDALDRCANDSMYFHGWTAESGIFAVSCEAPLTETVFTVVVPAATDSVFIVGDFTDWNFVKMSLVEGEDSVYTYAAEGDVRSMGYKYAAGPDWAYEESDQAENRTYAVKDTVLSFKAVPVAPQPVVLTDLYLLNAKALTEANAKMFVHAWGDGMSDQDVEMSILKEGNDTLGFSAKINKLAEHMIFVRMNGEAESINWESNWGKTVELDRCANDSMYFHGWTAESGIFAVNCEAPLTETVFTVVVPAATDSVFIIGDFTDWSFVKMSLVEGEDSVYTYAAEGDVRSMGYKYAAGPDWAYEESDQAENRTYAVKDTVLSFKAVPVAPQPVVRTDLYLLNAHALADSEAQMYAYTYGGETDAESVKMELVIENEDTLGYKGAINAAATSVIFVRMAPEAEAFSWTEGVWNRTGDNAICANDTMYFAGWSEEQIDGFNTFTVSCEAPAEPQPLCDKYLIDFDEVQYLFAPVEGKENVYRTEKIQFSEHAADEFILVNICEFTYVAPVLPLGSPFKVNDYGYGWYTIEATSLGLVALQIVVSADGVELSVAEDEPEIVRTDLYLLNGHALADGKAQMYAYTYGGETDAESVKMEFVIEGEDTLGYKGAINAAATAVIFVRMAPEAEAFSWTEGVWNRTGDNTICENDTMYFAGWSEEQIGGFNAFTVSCEAPAVPVEPTLANGYYLVGYFGGVEAWGVADLSVDKLFKANEGNEGEYVLDFTLAENDVLKVVYVENDIITTWYPDGENNDYQVDAAHAGEKTIYFRPDGQGGEDWHYGVIYIAPNPGSAIDNTAADASAVKVLRNGQILIIKGEKIFNAQGQLVK